MEQIPKNDVGATPVDAANQQDLLQQAFESIMDNEERINNYMVTWTQPDENDAAHTVQVIPGETISETNPTEKVMYRSCQETNVADVPVTFDISSLTQYQPRVDWNVVRKAVLPFNSINRQENPTAKSLATKTDCQNQKWQTLGLSRDMNSENFALNIIPVSPPWCTAQKSSPDCKNIYPPCQINTGVMEHARLKPNQDNSIYLTTGVSKVRKYKANENDKKAKGNTCCAQKTLTQNNQNVNVKVTQEEILQKLPKILPSTRQDTARTAQNSILQTNNNANISQDPKGVPTIINNQIINGAKVFTYTNNVPNQTVLTQCIPTNVVTTVPTTLTTNQIHLPSMSNNNSMILSNDLWKNVHPPPMQVLNIQTGKDTITVPELNKSMANNKTSLKLPTMKKLKRFVKAPYQTTTKADPRSLLKTAQLPSAQESLLKPEAKMNLKNTSDQNSMNIQQLLNSQTQLNGNNTLSNTQETKPGSQIIYLLQNGSSLTSVLSLSDTELKVRQILEQHKRNNIEQQPGAETKNCIVLCRVISMADVGIKNSASTNVLSNKSINTPQSLNNGHDNSYVGVEKNRAVKRGRPRKSAVQSSVLVPQSPAVTENEQKEVKDNLMNIARTRSGRLSRPPKHMVDDYKRLLFSKHLTCAQMDLNGSDNDCNRCITHNDRLEEQQESIPLLDGLDVPKRNISDRFKCPTCCKYYLGRSRLSNHFEKHPNHASCEQLASLPEPVQNQNNIQDPLKRKGKKRGPWAYATPEAKSRRRMKQLQDACAICESDEIMTVIAEIFDENACSGLVRRKLHSNLKNSPKLNLLLDNICKEIIDIVLLAMGANEENSKDMINNLNDWFNKHLDISSGICRINNKTLDVEESSIPNTYDDIDETPPKIRKIDDNEDTKKKNEEQISSEGSATSELNVCEFLNENRNNSAANSTCPDVLSALTLMPRNSHSITNTERSISNNASNVLISSSEIQNQISDNSGFQKVNINTLKASNFDKSDSHNSFVELSNSVETSNNIQPFHDTTKDNYRESTLDHVEQALRLEPDNQTFNNTVNTYQKQENLANIAQIQIKPGNIETESHSFARQFHNPSSVRTSELSSIEMQTPSLHTDKIISSKFDKILPNMPFLEDTETNIPNKHYENTFVTNDNLYFLPSIYANGEIDKNLSIDNYSANVNSADVSNIDDFVEERLQNIVLVETGLESNLLYNSNSYTDLNFETLTADFNNSSNT